MSPAHNIPVNTAVTITVSGAVAINGTYSAISISPNELKITKSVLTAGAGGTVTFVNGFVISGDVGTAANLETAINTIANVTNVTASIVPANPPVDNSLKELLLHIRISQHPLYPYRRLYLPLLRLSMYFQLNR